MAKSRWRRTWVKMWVNECLQGTIRFDFTPAERSVWYDLIILAGNCRVPGVISANETSPYPNSYIAGLLNIDLGLLEQTLEKCKTSGRVKETKRGIELVNWEHYQSEYERQKPYRLAKKLQDVHPPIDTDILREINLRYKKKRKELGREPTPQELQDIKDEVNSERGAD